MKRNERGGRTSEYNMVEPVMHEKNNIKKAL
jgi:hypothetical protein